MIKAISIRKLAASIGKTLAMTGPALVLIACESDLLPGSKEVLVEAVANTATTAPLESYQRETSLEALKPLHLGFNTNAFFSSDASNWLYRGDGMTFVPDQGHQQLGSVMVHNRSETFHGPLLTLPMLETGQAYRATMWIKLLETEQPVEAKLALLRVADGILTTLVLNQLEIQPDSWQKVEGEFLGNLQGEDDVIALSLEVKDVKTKYLVDDVVVAHAEYSASLEAAAQEMASRELMYVRNGDLEEGMSSWSHQGGVISRSTVHAHTGTYSLLISGRSQSWHAPTASVFSLEDDRRYRFSMFVRLNDDEPPANVRLTLKRVTSGQATYVPLGESIASSNGWVEVAGIFTGTNISKSTEVVVYLESLNPTSSYFVDTLTVQELPDQ